MDDLGSIAHYVQIHVGLLATMAVAVMLLAGSILPLAPFYQQAPLLFLLYAAFVFPQVYMLDWVTTGLQQMKWTGAYGVIRSAVYAACVVLVLPHLTDGDAYLAWVPALYLISFFLADAVLAWHLGRILSPSALRPRWGPLGQWRARLSDASPIGAALIVMRILLNVDVLILGILTDATTVGVYAAASKLMIVLITGSDVAWKVLLPRLSQSWSQSPPQFHHDFRRFTVTALALLLPIAAGGWAVGTRFIHLIYDERFRAAGPLFQTLAVAYSLLALGIFFGNGLIASNRQRAYLPSVALAAIVVVALNLWRVPRAGAEGAAQAVLIAATVLSLLTGWQMRDSLRSRSFLAPVAILVAATALMSWLVLQTAEEPVLVSIAVGLVSYVLLAGPWVWRWLRRPPA
jgi:O-antigen/teichoic acid export membrane protein